MDFVFWNDGTELYHYGIPGQKWGARRFQNQDGSLTEEGRRRYGVGDRISAGRDRIVARDRATLNESTQRRLNRAKVEKAKDMQGFTKDALKNGIRDKNGRLIATADDVKQWKKDTAKKHDEKINDIKKTSEYRQKALDVERSMSNGRYFANAAFSAGYGTISGTRSYASLVASGFSEKHAQTINALLGAAAGQTIADLHAKKTYGIKKIYRRD